HDAEREDRHPRQIAAREHVVEAEHGALHLPREFGERGDVDARHRDVVADAVHRQHPQREQHAVPQVGDREDVLQAVVHSCSVAPPAAAIFSAALPLNLCARTVSAFPTSPRPRIFTRAVPPGTSPRSRSSSGVTTVPASNFRPSMSRFTTSYATRNGLWKPRFGTRRCSGICPPSNPRLNLNPERDFAPLCPRPAVLPWPDPWPRPIRFLACFIPAGGRKLLRAISSSLQLGIQHSESGMRVTNSKFHIPDYSVTSTR